MTVASARACPRRRCRPRAIGTGSDGCERIGHAQAEMSDCEIPLAMQCARRPHLFVIRRSTWHRAGRRHRHKVGTGSLHTLAGATNVSVVAKGIMRKGRHVSPMCPRLLRVVRRRCRPRCSGAMRMVSTPCLASFSSRWCWSLVATKPRFGCGFSTCAPREDILLPCGARSRSWKELLLRLPPWSPHRQSMPALCRVWRRWPSFGRWWRLVGQRGHRAACAAGKINFAAVIRRPLAK